MSYEYSDPTRESDPRALPDVETFYCASGECIDHVHEVEAEECWFSVEGYYFAYVFPCCSWDGEPQGPYPTEAEALAAARSLAED